VITFWLVCGIMVAIALAFVLPPLWERSNSKKLPAGRGTREANITVYQSQIKELETDLKTGLISSEQYEQDRDEVERRLLEDVSTSRELAPAKSSASQSRSAAYAVALGLPIVAVVLYLQIGNPNASSRNQQPAQPAAAGDFSQQRIEANVAALASRLEQNPNDVQGWTMLGRSYLSLERYSEASRAYSKATELKKDDADLWVDYAIAVAMVQNQRLQGQPVELLEKALQVDPQNAKALELAGNAAFEARDYRRAIDYWEKVVKGLPSNSEVAESVLRKINEAKTRAGNENVR